MPAYNVTDPTTGASLRLTGDSPPTEAELNLIFATRGGIPVLTTAPKPGIMERVRDYLGIGHQPKSTPLDIEAMEKGVSSYQIAHEVFGTGREEELRRVLSRGMSGFTGGLTDLVRGYEEDPETFVGTMAGSAANLAGFIFGPLKAARAVTGGFLAPTSEGLRGVAQILTQGSATLGLASGLSRIIPSFIEHDNLSDMAHDVFGSGAMGALVGAIYPAMGVVPTRPLKMALTFALMDKIRAGTKEWFTLPDVIKGVANGTKDKKDLAERTFGYLMDLYFAAKVPSMKGQMKALAGNAGKPIIDEMAKIDPDEAEQSILATSKTPQESQLDEANRSAQEAKGAGPRVTPPGEKNAPTEAVETLRPAIKINDRVTIGEEGQTHPDIGIKGGERGFATPEGEFLTRDEAKNWVEENQPDVYRRWERIAGTEAELHSEDYNEAQKPEAPGEAERFEGVSVNRQAVNAKEAGNLDALHTEAWRYPDAKTFRQAMGEQQDDPDGKWGEMGFKSARDFWDQARRTRPETMPETDMTGFEREEEPKTRGKRRYSIRPDRERPSATMQGAVVPGLREFYEQDIVPKAERLGRSLADTWRAFKHLVAPRAGVRRDIVDSIMKMKGARDKMSYVLEVTTKKAEKILDTLSQDQQVEFIDNMKRGRPQATPELQQISDMIRAIDTGIGEELKARKPSMSWVENHFRVLWKVIPGSREEGFKGIFRRPLEGSEGYFKKHTLQDMTQGLEMGGEPYTYNAVRMLRLHHADAQKYLTAQNMWDRLKDLGARVFVRFGQSAPDGFVRLNDRIARVYVPVQDYGRYVTSTTFRETEASTVNKVKETITRLKDEGAKPGEEPSRGQRLMEDRAREALQARGWSEGETEQIISKVKGAPAGEAGNTIIERQVERTINRLAEVRTTREWVAGKGLVNAGEWNVEEGAGRLLNNFLSRDLVRESAAGRGLMWIKNSTTAVELGLNLFHGTFETTEAMGSGLGAGIRKTWNQGVLGMNLSKLAEGFKDMFTSPAAPFESARLGGSAVKYIANKAEFLETTRGQDFIKRYPNAGEMIDLLFTGGGRLAMHEDYRINTIKTFRESISANNYIGAAIRAIPALNEVMMQPLFEQYIPRLKIGRFLMEASNELEHRDADIKAGLTTREEVAQHVWDFVENRFGEMNFDNLFWDRTFKSALQLVVRSVTWKLGNIRLYGQAVINQSEEFASAFKQRRLPELSMEMSWVFGMAATTAVMSSIIQYMAIGERPKSLEDFVFPRIDKEGHRLSLPTYMRDLYSLAHSGIHYVGSGLAGWLGRFGGVIKNKDFYGVQVHDQEDGWIQQRVDDAIHLIPTPFGISSYMRLKQEGDPMSKQIMSFIGFGKAPYYIEQSHAEQLAGDLLQQTFSQKPRTKEEFERANLDKKYARELADALKEKAPIDDIVHRISADIQAGALHIDDAKKIGARMKQPLQGKVSRLSAEDALKVWPEANDEERKQIGEIILQKINRMKSPEDELRLKPKIDAFKADIRRLLPGATTETEQEAAAAQ